MSGIDLMAVAGQLLGGLSLFLFGMEKMSHGARSQVKRATLPAAGCAHTAGMAL
jgi:hypothetical protein